MKKIFLPVILCIFFFSGCVETPEQAGSRISKEEAAYQSAYDDGFEAGYNESKKYDIMELENEIISLEQQIEDLEWELEIFKDYVTIVTLDDYLYHRDLDCNNKSAYYDIISLEGIENKGFHPCPECLGESNSKWPSYEEMLNYSYDPSKPYGPSPAP